MSPKPRLFSLLIAINDYQPPVTPLHGCVNDLEKVKAYLQKEADNFNVKIKTLINEKATKEAVVSQFNEHLSQASEGDVALFYFSGHGTQEEADPVFWNIEEDQKLEALVFYDSYSNAGGRVKIDLLADKELRYLIHKISQKNAHILTIFDCCHSGGNTRNAYISEQIEEVKERRFINRVRLSQAFPVRKWEDFIFSKILSYEEAQKQPIAQLLPEGKHIQMAACQNDQSAYEVKGEGVFTKNLLEILYRCEGAVTYYDLKSRIQNFIKNQFDQSPRIFISGEDETGLFKEFLNKKAEGKPTYGNINYNPDLGWIMDLGAIHGISPQASKIKVLSLDGQDQYTAEILKVFTAYTQISFEQEEENKMDVKASYKGYLNDYFSYPIGVYLNIQEPSLREEFLKLISSDNPNINIMKATFEADYIVHYSNNQLLITRPGTPAIPVVKPQGYESKNDLEIILKYLNHLSQYKFVKELHNPNTFLYKKDPIELRVLKRSSNQKENPVAVTNGEILLEYDQQEKNQYGGSIRLALRNNTNRKLYCALLYLSFNFGVSTKLLKEVVVGLEPNKEVWALDGAPIGLTLEEEIVEYNYKENISYIKLIVSTTDFKHQATRFEMPSLPGPHVSKSPGAKGLDVDIYNPGNIEDWTTRLFTIKIKNPLYHPKKTT